MSMMDQILVADDHPIVRSGIIHLLEQYYRDCEVTAVSDGEQALVALSKTEFDLAILDISMPGIDGLRLVNHISQNHRNTISVLLTFHDDQAYIDKAFEYGARGYLLKEDAEENILECIDKVKCGERYLSHTLVTPALSTSSMPKDSTAELTPTELKIIGLVADYKTSKEISSALCVTVRTVQNHRANIVRKLDLSGSNALLKYAVSVSQAYPDN